MERLAVKRESNLELYRILVMFAIVAHHYVVNSGLVDLLKASPLSGPSVFYYLFAAWGKTGINCFVLITGYFMCKSEATISKVLKLFLEVEFYSIAIYMCFVITGYEPFSVQGMFKEAFPFSLMTNDNFVSCYIAFYIFIPYLNVLIRNITRNQHKWLVVSLLFIYTVWETLPGFYIQFNYIPWFVTLYFIASYLRLYPLKSDNSAKTWCMLMLLSLTLSVLSVLVMLWHNGGSSPYRFVSDSNTLLALTNGITSFMFFKSLKIRYSKSVNLIAASTFGVLCIHASSETMRRWLWDDLFCNASHYSDTLFWARPIFVCLIVFMSCIFIDYIRIHALEKWYMGKIGRMVPKWFC